MTGAEWVAYPAMFLTIILSIGTVFSRWPVMGAMCLIGSLLSAAVLYVLMDATFVALAQVLIYAGGILVLFIYILILLGVKRSRWGFLGKALLSFTATLLFVLVMMPVGHFFEFHSELWAADIPQGFGTIQHFGSILMRNYSYPFELVSVILLAVIVGVVFLTRKSA